MLVFKRLERFTRLSKAITDLTPTKMKFSMQIELVSVFLHSNSRYQQRTAVFCKNSDSVQLIIICYFIVLFSEIESGNGMNHD